MSKRDKVSLFLLVVLIALTAAELYADSSRRLGWMMLALTVISGLRFGIVQYARRRAPSGPQAR